MERRAHRLSYESSLTKLASVLYPEGAVGHVDLAPGDDDGVLNGFGGNVDAEVGAVCIICDLYVDGEALCIL